MLDVFNFPTPQQSNYQEFHYTGYQLSADGSDGATWLKPRGASMVRMMLIGAGGGGGNGSSSVGGGGGGSGAVTSWIGPAIFLPDSLIIQVGKGGSSGVAGEASKVLYRTGGTYYVLLSANAGTSGNTTVTAGTNGAAMTNNAFGASGIFTSTAGQAGVNGGSTGNGSSNFASSTTFLGGGAGGAGGATSTGGQASANYGYFNQPTTTPFGGVVKGGDGYFLTQPILVGCGGSGGTTNTSGVGSDGGRGGIGCGGGGAGEDAASGGRGGDGAVFIWSW